MRIPERLKPIAQVVYRQLLNENNEPSGREGFEDTFFDGEAEYRRLHSEVSDSGIREVVEGALEQYNDLTAGGAFGSVDKDLLAAWYALVRSANQGLKRPIAPEPLLREIRFS